jgi:hypothetical protein
MLPNHKSRTGSSRQPFAVATFCSEYTRKNIGTRQWA